LAAASQDRLAAVRDAGGAGVLRQISPALAAAVALRLDKPRGNKTAALVGLCHSCSSNLPPVNSRASGASLRIGISLLRRAGGARCWRKHILSRKWCSLAQLALRPKEVLRVCAAASNRFRASTRMRPRRETPAALWLDAGIGS